MKTSTFNTVKAIFLMLTITAIASLLTSCAKPPGIPIAWWVKCHSEIQAPLDRVGTFNGQFFTTQEPAELYGCLPTPYGYARHELYRSLYSIHLTNLKAGDIIHFDATAVLTNDLYTVAVLAESYVELASSPTDVDGIVLDHPEGYNISPEMHHGIISQSGNAVIPHDYADVYLNYVIYSAGAEMLDANLVIEQGYGALNGYIIRSTLNAKPTKSEHKL